MNGSVYGRRFLPDILHDVYLATIGPAKFFDVVAQHPKGRPHALTGSDSDARLKSSIGLGEFAHGLEPCRCVLPAPAVRPWVIFF